ncbi:MAG: succinate dehydrogenase, hydrophobic membrane anchor protein [Rickettsiales bacterium]|nr:succinate dehydrogenase, hydrophobic membrane anchor protein [Rickettsiales bacterium]|tara:strand:+ start:227 stop:598 length:372 start_codon:yes stop_codon:yes gene_type:complete
MKNSKEKVYNTNEVHESGLKHWWQQKLTAVAMLPLSVWLLLNLPKFLSLSYEKKVIWLNSIPNFIFLIFFLLIASYHMRLGLTVVVEDYIHNIRIKFFLLKTLEIFTLAVFVLIMFIIFLFVR